MFNDGMSAVRTLIVGSTVDAPDGFVEDANGIRLDFMFKPPREAAAG